MLLHGAQMRPAREQRDIETGARHARADVSSDCARSRDEKFHSCYREGCGDGSPSNFPRRGGGNTLDQINLLRAFVFRQKLAAVLDELGFGRASRFMQHHGRGHFFAQRGMRAAEAYCRGNCRMPQQNLVDFMRRNVLASANNDVFDPSGQMQIAIRHREIPDRRCETSHSQRRGRSLRDYFRIREIHSHLEWRPRPAGSVPR